MCKNVLIWYHGKSIQKEFLLTHVISLLEERCAAWKLLDAAEPSLCFVRHLLLLLFAVSLLGATASPREERCCGLRVFIHLPSNSWARRLKLAVMVLGDGTFGGRGCVWWGHEGGALIDGISALIRETLGTPPPLLHRGRTPQVVCNLEEASHLLPCPLISAFQPPESWEIGFCCL